MKKVGGGRPKDDDVRRHVEVLEEGRRWKCKYCEREFAGGASRIRSHIYGEKGKGIRACAKYVPDKGNSNDLRDNLQHCQQGDYSMPNKAGQSQADAKYPEGVRVVGSSSVTHGENEDLKVIQYVFKCLSPADKVFDSALSYLTQEEFATLRPETFLDSLVIDVFAEMLTHIERKKKTTPSNWYLPVTFSEAALKRSIGRFLDFVDRQKIKQNYMSSQIDSCEKVFIPVHIEAKPNCGHFYLSHFSYYTMHTVIISDSLFPQSRPSSSHSYSVDSTQLLLLTGVSCPRRFNPQLEIAFRTVIMKKVGGGRPKDDDVRGHVEVLEEGRRWKCKYCEREFAGGASRIRSHINGEKGKGIRACAKYVPDKGNSNDLRDNLQHCQQGDYSMPNEAGQSQADAKYQEGVPVVGSSSVSDGENEDLKVLQYVFECLSPEDTVFRYPLSHLTREEFATLRPGTCLNSAVIDIFAEMLTHMERKKKITPSNWFLPVTFSEAALKYSIADFLDFVHRQKIRENYMFDLKSCEKNEEIEIWDSLFNTFVTVRERHETTKKLLLAMEKLFEKFEKVAFTKFRSKMEMDILEQPNAFDCGIFVMKFMEQSENYVKRNSSFQFDSEKERKDLASKLLDSDLNQEKQNLYDRARRHYVQVERQDGHKRLPFDKVDRHDPLEKGSSKGYILPTTDLIGWNFRRNIQDIWRWIMDDKVSAIGIWGIGGSGKTALATHIHNQLILEEATSDIKVIWVTVSQNSTLHLQKVIAKSIELDISDEFEVKRIAGKLFQASKEMNRCVIILDDVWDHFFLKDIGFPMSDNRIKLILTTRIWNVCQGMGCKKVIKVKPLKKEERWDLFDEFLGSFREELSSEVENIAQNVAQACEGFPLAIVRIATSMKGETEAGEWRQMLECLRNLDNGQYEMDKWVFPVLRSSYDFLNNKLQRFFLCCALSTNGILNDDEADHWIRRFVYENIDERRKLRVQYNEGYNILYKLKNHSMLDRHASGWRINKFLRALAIGIAEETCKIMGKAYKYLTEIPSDDQWKEDLQKVFLMGNHIQTIPNGTCPKCSQVSTLLLNCNVFLNHIPDEFFNNMPTLKILDLSETMIERLPASLSKLKCLIALLISGCTKLSYIPSLGKLKRLISLDLSSTAITEAPTGLESLVNLRRLSLLPTEKLKMSAWLLSTLINLECLEAGWAQCSTDVIGQGTQGLKRLEVIVAHFCDISVFNNFVSFMAHNCVTRSYRLTLGGARYDLARYYIHKKDREYSVKKILIRNVDWGNEKVILPGGIEELVIENCGRGKGDGSILCSVLSSGHNNNPSQIKLLEISSCNGLECLYCCNCPFCPSTQLVGCLKINCLTGLEDLVSPYADSLHQCFLFSDLTDLNIRGCHSMEALMTPKLLAHLQNLRTIDVDCCSNMKEMVGAEEDHSELEPTAGSGDLLLPNQLTLPKLTSLKLNLMAELYVVYRGIMLCPSLQTFSAIYCEQLNHPQIAISNDGGELRMEKTPTGYRWGINIDSDSDSDSD